MNQISSKILLTVCAMFAILAILAAPGAFAANQTDTWTGSASLNLGDAGNWTGGNAPPIAGDSWVFGQAGLGATLNNSFSGGMTVSNLTFNGPSAFIFNSAVNPIIVTNFLTNASTAIQTFNTAFSNTGPVTLTLTAGGGDLTINGNLNNNTSLTLAGTGGNLTLTDTNNFTGALIIGTNNTLTLSGPTAALGTNTSYITTTYLTNGTTITTNYTTNSDTTTYLFAGAITDNGQIVYSSSLSLTNTGVISGGGATPGLVINGPGVFALGNMNNSFTNNIVVNGGRLSATAGTYTGARANGALGNQYIDGRTLTINPGGVLSLESANVFASSGTPNHLTIYNNSYMQLIGSGEDELFTNLYLNAATNYVFITNGNWYYPCAIFGGSVNVSGANPSYFTAGTYGTGSGSTGANGGNGCGWGLGYTGSAGYQTPFNVAVTAGGSGSGGADLIISATLYNMANQASIPSGILMNGPGTMLLSGSNLFTGPITVSAGSLIVGNAGYLNSNSFPGRITVNSGANFTYSSSAQQTFAGTINNSGTFTYSSSATGTFAGAINNNSSFVVSSASPVLFQTPSFSGTGTLALNGPGTTYILANTSYTGLTTVNGGEVVVFSSQANTAPVTVNDGATLAVIASPGGVTGFSPSTLTVGSASGANVQVVINSTTQAPLTVGALSLTGNNNIFTVNASVALAASQSYPVLSYTTISGPALTSANFVKPAGITGTFTSSASGGVTTWSLNVATGGVASPLTWVGNVNNGVYGVWDVATTANWSGASDFQNGDPVLFDDTANIFEVGGVGTVIPAGITFNNSANNYGVLGTVAIAGTGGVTLNGSGFVTNSGVNSYSGATVINNGTLVAGTNSVGLGGPLGAFYAPVSIKNVATAGLNLNGNSVQVGSVSGGGTSGGNVTLGSGTLTVGADGTSQTFAGDIIGSGGLTLTGAGSLTLTDTNAFTGSLKVGALNTLTLSGPTSALGTLANPTGGTYAGAITDNGWLVYSTSLNQTNSGLISGTGGIILNGPGILAVSDNANSFTNNIVVNGGILADNTGYNGNNTGLGAVNVVGRTVTINNGGLVSLNNGGGNDFSGGTGNSQLVFVVNQGGVLQNGTANGNIYMTNIFLNGGTITAGSANVGGTQWPAWDLGGSIIVAEYPSIVTAAIAGTTGNGTGYSLGANNSAGYQTPFVVSPTTAGSLAGLPDLTVSASLYNSDDNQSATGFILSGGGTMALNANNFFTGPITVSAGTLNLSGAGMLGNAATLLGGNYAGAINIASGGTFLFTSTMGQTNSGVISGAGNLVVSNTSGPGLALSNNVNTLSGSVVIGAGTLFLEGSASLANASTIAISNGATFDVSQVTRVSGAGTGQNIIGFGTVNGNFTTPANALIEGGVPGNAGTLAFNGNLTLGNASGFRAVLSTSATAGPNSLVTVSGSLAFLGAQIHVVAPAGQDLDTQDYTLVTATGGLGSSTFSPAVIWDVAPANANQYFVEISGNSLVLHYSSVPLPIPGGTTSPSTVLRNQTPQIVVTVVPGQAGSTVNSVTVDTSSIGGPNNLSLTAGAGNTWTGSVFISPTNLVGTYLLPATAVDSTQTTGYGDVTVFIVASTETWAGAGSSPWDFDTAANWAIETGETAAYAPGYIGDSLIFAGKTGPSPVMDNSYSVNGLGFASGAGPFNITATSTNILTITGGTTNLSSATNTLALPVLSGTTGPLSINAGSGVLALTKGLADENGGLTVIGSSGNFALSGNSTFTGPLVVQQGTMTLTGPTTANTNAVILANASGSNAVLTIGSGGSMNITNTGLPSGSWGTDLLVLNEATNATGILNLNSGGNFTTALALATGNGSGGYSYVNMTGGTLQLGSFFYAGGSGYDTARVDISGGTLNILSNCISVSGGAYSNTNSHGLMNFSGNAVLNSAQSEGPDFQYGGRGGLFVGEFGPAVLNVMGNAILNVYGDTNVVMGVWNFAGANGTINLLGGAIVTAQVSGGSGHSTFNFNGGLLSNYAGSINWSGLGTATTSVQGPAFMFNVNNTYVYSGGAVIDDGGAAITINEPLQAPAGYGIGTAGGVGSILPKAKGSGYIAPPVVLISGGTGIGAMANAVVSGGQVTGYTVTCPGTGYSASDTLTVTLLGGGGSGATATNAPLVLNTSGGLIYSSAPGGGSLTLSAPATYTGPTVAKSGRLTVGTGGSILNSTVFAVSNGAIMDFSQVGGLALGNTYLLEGSGIVNGKVTANAGAKIYPGTDPVIGTLTLNSGLNMVLGSIATFDLTNSGVLGSSNDQVVVAGTGSLNFANNTIHIKSINGAALDTANAYTLFQNNSSALAGLPSVTPVFDVAPANASTGHWLIQPQGNNIVLMNSATAAPNGSGSITAGGTGSPATNIIRNTSINVTVTAATAVSVSMDLSSYGGSQYTFTPGSGGTWTATGVAIPAGMPPGPITLPIVIFDGTLYGNVALAVNILTTADVWSGADFNNSQVADDNANWQHNVLGVSAAPGYVGDSVIFQGTTGLTPIFEQYYTFNGIGFASGAGQFILSSSAGSVSVTGGITNNAANVETVNMPLTLTGANAFFTGASTGTLVLGNAISGSGQMNVAAGAGGVTMNGTVAYNGNTFIATGGSLILGPTGQYQDPVLGTASFGAPITNNGSLVFSNTTTMTMLSQISGSGTILVGGPGTICFSNVANLTTNDIIVNGGTLLANAGTYTGGRNNTALGNIYIDGRTITINNGGTLMFDSPNVFPGGNIANNLTWIVNKGGTVGVEGTGENEVFSNVFLNGGTMNAIVGNGNTWPSFIFQSSVTVGGTTPSTLSAASAGTTANGVGFALGMANGPGYQTPFIVNQTAGGSLAGGADLIVSGTLYNCSQNPGNANGFTKSGLGTMLLSGTNLFTGNISVTAGTVIEGNAGNIDGGLYAGNIAISSGATFAFGSSQFQTNSGAISGAGTLLVNNGTGSGLVLSNSASTLTGPVVITNAGTLFLIAGSSLGSPSGISIAGGATFDVSQLASPYVWPAGASATGSGTAGSAATINSAGAVTIGSSSSIILNNYDGTDPGLTINGSLTLGGANQFVVNGAALAPGQYSLIYASGGITDPAGYPPVTGTAIGPTSSGSISVSGNSVVLTVTAINAAPPPIQFSLSGKVLTLNWPTNSGWTLQSNSINIAVPGDWYNVPGSSAVTTFPININTANKDVFYRLVLP